MQSGFASALVVEKFASDKRYYIGRGMYGIPCPVQTGKCASCIDCNLCMKDKSLISRKNVILFEAHGNGRKNVVKVLNDAKGK